MFITQRTFEDTKSCLGCERVLPFNRFCISRKRPGGDNYYQSRCMDCANLARYRMPGGAFMNWNDLQAMKAEQDNKCAICGSVEPLHVDHDHEVGYVRGLLCCGCNHGLGKFRDDPERLVEAAAYLVRGGRTPRS